MNPPNIFDYATSELSQDAFFAWLLKWGEDGYKNLDKDLNKCAVKLLKIFFKKYYDEFGDEDLRLIEDFESITKIKSIVINRQEEKIDLYFTIETYEQAYNLVIEDKTNSTEHNNQLKRYREYFDKEELSRTCFIYLKTGKLARGEPQKVKKEKYALFDLNSVYDVMKKCNSKDGIFNSFFSKIETLYYVRSFETNRENRIFFDTCIGKKNYKYGVWKDNCFWFYKKTKLKKYPGKKYLALDVWINNKTLVFVFHAIDNLNGHWITNSKVFNSIKEIKEIISKNRNKEYEKKENHYYERSVPYKDLAELNKLIRKEIKDLLG